jgi:hypothetical protein
MRAGIEIGTCRRLSVALAWILAVVGSGCDDNCDGGTWLVGTTSVCAATGGATVTSPASYGLPATVPVADGHSCMGGGGGDVCWDYPFVRLAQPFGRGQNGIELSIRLPIMGGSATYTFPTAWTVPYFSVTAGLNSMSGSGSLSAWNLEVVSGTVDVETSTASELRLSFQLELALPSTMETFAITGGVAVVSGCHVEENRVCAKGDD